MQEENIDSSNNPYLLAQVREAYGRVVYSHKTHEKQADISFVKHRRLQWAFIVLTAVSSGTFLITLMGLMFDNKATSLATSFIALLVTVMSLVTKNLNFGEEFKVHRDIASKLWDVRESYLSLISDSMSGEIDYSQAQECRNSLQKAAQDIYHEAPRTSRKAFLRAQKGLKYNEEMTFTDNEIDLFLPRKLRITESDV